MLFDWCVINFHIHILGPHMHIFVIFEILFSNIHTLYKKIKYVAIIAHYIIYNLTTGLWTREHTLNFEIYSMDMYLILLCTIFEI